MVSQETVLVVGAGASIPYNYPSGQQLVQNVTRALAIPAGSTSLGQILLELGYDEKEIFEFADSLFKSGLNSIDAFIERRSKQYLQIGKATIAASLIPFEDPAGVFQKGDWYQQLFNRLAQNYERKLSQKITIVTYNYDRSLDYYLFTAFRNAYGYPVKKTLEILDNIKIIHVHGVLCPLPWEESADGFVRKYGEDNAHSYVRKAAEKIKIIHENVNSDSGYSAAHSALLAASRVCFLGFGYNPTNVVRLLGSSWHMNKQPGRVVGSAYDFTDSEKNEIRSLFGGRIELGGSSYPCLDFIRENSWILT